MNTDKYKKQLNKLKKQVGMDGRAKKSRVGIITDEIHPHTFFIETPLLGNKM